MELDRSQFFVHMRTELANVISKFEKKHKCHVLMDTKKVGMYVHEEDYLEYLKKNNLEDDR